MSSGHLTLLGEYPQTPRYEVVERVAEIRTVDPYRWLEGETDDVLAWQTAQAELATTTIAASCRVSRARELIEHFAAGSRPTLPRRGGDHWFRATHDDQGTTLVVASSAFGQGRVLVRLDDLAVDEQAPVIAWLRPSPDGRVLAFGVCTDGSEHHHVHLVDVDSGRLHADHPRQMLHSAWAGGVSWSADGSGFHYFALTGTAEEFRQAVFYYKLGDHDGTVVDVPVPEGSHEYTYVEASADGRWLVASHRLGSPIAVAVRDVVADGPWRSFITDCSGTVAGHVLGDELVAVTDLDAPRGRLVAIPLDAESPSDPSEWRELLPETDAVLCSVEVVAGHLYVSELVDTAARIRVLTPEGVVVEEVPLPDAGALAAPFFRLTALSSRASDKEFLFAHSSPVRSWGVYSHRPGEGVQTLVPPRVQVDGEVAMDVATSEDGTAIPFLVVRPAGLTASPSPTLISAYGAAGVATLPAYQPDLAAYVAAGGVLVQAYLRGGGEFGRDWFRAADRERRAVRDADLVAVAEHLIDTGLTTPRQLALTGGSDGGLMCGVAVTSRPDLWVAVLPREPLFDLIGGIRHPYLEFVIRKAWGDPDLPGDVRRLQAISPYERVVPADYPAVYVQAGAEDARCPPWQARKFVARLQAAQLGAAPILLHVWDNAGHGAATSASVAADQDTEWLAFLMAALRLPLTPGACP
jgi:prolyl oligopeptidase